MAYAMTVLLLILLTTNAVWAQAQIPISKLKGQSGTIHRNSSANNNISSTTLPDTVAADSTQQQQVKGVIPNDEEDPDTARHKVFMFHLSPLQVKIAHITAPTLDPSGSEAHDVLNAIMDGHYYLSKGIVGHQHYDVYPTYRSTTRWSYQPNVNIGYEKTPENVHYLQTQRPYTILSYGSSLKSEYVVHVGHSQNPLPRWNLSLDYKLINPDGIYSNTAAQNHYLDATTNYYTRDSRYQMYTGVIWQKYRIGENGGLADDEIFTSNRESNSASIPMRYYDRNSVYNTLDIFTHHTYNFVRQVERVYERMRMVPSESDSTLMDTLVYYDTVQPDPTHMLNKGVVGLDLTMQRSARRYIDSTTVFHYQGRFYWTNDAYPDYRRRNPLKLTVGVDAQLIHINERDSLKNQFGYLSPFAKAEWSLWRGVLRAKATTTVGGSYQKGDRHIDADYTFSLDSMRDVSAYFTMSAQAPDYIYYHYHSNGHRWDRETYDKKRLQRFGAKYQHKGLIDAELTASHINHDVWLEGDSTALHPVQSDKDYWLLQGRLTLRLRFWSWLHWDMQQMVQYSSDEQQLSVPVFASKNSIYADLYLFKHALRAQIGIDVRYHTRFYADNYSPTAGAFVRQHEIQVGNFFWGDIFANLQIKKATIYVKLGHVNALWESHPNYLLLPHYPGTYLGFYYGFIWKFFD